MRGRPSTGCFEAGTPVSTFTRLDVAAGTVEVIAGGALIGVGVAIASMNHLRRRRRKQEEEQRIEKPDQRVLDEFFASGEELPEFVDFSPEELEAVASLPLSLRQRRSDPVTEAFRNGWLGDLKDDDFIDARWSDFTPASEAVPMSGMSNAVATRSRTNTALAERPQRATTSASRQTTRSPRHEKQVASARPRKPRLLGRAWHFMSILVLLLGGFFVLHGLYQPESTRWVRMTKPIEQFRPGNKVAAGNPLEEPDFQFGEDVDPKTWRFLELLAPKEDGTYSEIDMIRPLWWLEDQQAEVGNTIFISVPECGINGNAEILNIRPCPPIDEGPGRVVTAVFRHHVDSTIGVVLSDREQINCTANHLWYSAERDEFVRTDQLRQREKLASITGDDLRVESLLARPGPKTVYNLEVQVDHVYHVGQKGALVHNGTPCPWNSWQHATKGWFKSSVRRSKAYWARRGLGQNATITNAFMNTKVIPVHGPLSTVANKSRFSSVINIRSAIRATLDKPNVMTPNTFGRPGTIFIRDFGHATGFDKFGNPVTRVKVVIDQYGRLITAYPFR